MLTKKINLLIVEDCPFTSSGYKNVLEQSLTTPLQITYASNCDEAVKQIMANPYNLVLLDLQLPVVNNDKYVCGEDLGLLIRKTQKDAKIIVLTNITDALRINSVINEIVPDGFMIKANSDPKDLKLAIETIFKGNIYYCKTTKNYITNFIEGITIDDYDRQILYHLSMGEKTKDICKYISLSNRAIEVRKNKLRTYLILNDKSDFNIVKAAKKLGII